MNNEYLVWKSAKKERRMRKASIENQPELSNRDYSVLFSFIIPIYFRREKKNLDENVRQL